jgi:hypothetical protein
VTAPALSDAQVEAFAKGGYLAIERLTSDAEVERLRVLYERVLADPKVIAFRFEGGAIHQAMSPDLHYPELRDSEVFHNGRRLACRLLGIAEDELDGFFTHMIYKPPGSGRDTPWHQDEAYWDNLDTVARSVSVWIPLDPVRVESGCMQFVPGSHDGDVRRHRRLTRFPPLLVVDEAVDFAPVVACPLAPGGATFHHCRTLHYTAPNATGVPRRALAFTFHAKPARREAPLPKPWLALDAAGAQA